ncbi:MAG: hypothetical protein IPQ07_18065 [Myxococcales bacterium]|nr:hypothetical protein [Myxococcales bacterium]
MAQKEHQQSRAANHQFAAPHRIAPFPATVDVGEQVVGSDHLLELAAPQVVDGFKGTATILGSVAALATAARGAPFEEGLLAQTGPSPAAAASSFALEAGPYGMPRSIETAAPEPLRIRFRPTIPGSASALVTIRIYWSDGGYTDRAVVVTGRGRAIDAVPHPNQVDRDRSPTDAPTPTTSDLEPAADLGAATLLASNNAATLAADQAQGVLLAQAEAKSFQEAATPPGWWAVLAEIAISMGIAAVAGLAAKSIAQRLTGKLIGELDPKVIRDSKVFTGLSDGVKEGMKTFGKRQAQPLLPKGSKPGHPDPAGSGRFSSNPTIDFWQTQTKLTNDVATHNRNLIRTTRDKVLGESPNIATRAMQELAAGFADARDGDAVIKAQAFASETQWISGIAQASHGHATATDHEKQIDVTDTQHVGHSLHFQKVNGLLRIAATRGSDGRVVVTGAKMTGIAQEIADRMWGYPLLHVPLPVMIELETADRSEALTRDEAGRIRIDRGPLDADDGEVQRIQDATQVFAAVLSKSLADWGLPEVKTDDATGRGDAS